MNNVVCTISPPYTAITVSIGRQHGNRMSLKCKSNILLDPPTTLSLLNAKDSQWFLRWLASSMENSHDQRTMNCDLNNSPGPGNGA